QELGNGGSPQHFFSVSHICVLLMDSHYIYYTIYWKKINDEPVNFCVASENKSFCFIFVPKD
ncbi:MAG: hypothetical protein IJY71_05085, partial [Clostridia bacterium]|nr:hypothetical protein [Clostridia bacterium]